MSPVLVTAQCFGILPVSGIRNKNPELLRFKFCSLKVIYATLLLIGVVIMAALSINHMFKTISSKIFTQIGGVAASTSGAAFYSNGALSTLFFYLLAKDWPDIIREVCKLENAMWNYDRNNGLSKHIKILTCLVLFASLVEHLVSVFVNASDFLSDTNKDRSFRYFLYDYCMHSHAFIFTNVDYSFSMGMLILLISNTATFTWNFQDIFVMVMSLFLSRKLKLLNDRLCGSKKRELYAQHSSLVKYIDAKISIIITISFVNNLYFICLQLLNGLRPKTDTLFFEIYFYGGFFFLIFRAAAVTLYAAQINDFSKTSLETLYNCPSDDYCVETERLLTQIYSDNLALSGMGFFFITRNFLLAVLGAIITYEVVLLQFDVSGSNSNVVNKNDTDLNSTRFDA